MGLPNTGGGHEAAVAAAVAAIRGGECGAPSSVQLVQEHLRRSVGEKPGVQEFLIVGSGDGSGRGRQNGSAVMLGRR